MGHPRVFAAFAIVGVLLFTLGINARAVPLSPAGLSRIAGLPVIEFVQDKPKSETVKQTVKRIWRNLTGYKFDVACPAFQLAFTRTSCVITGKNREDARAKCQAQNLFCQIRDAN